MNDNKETSQHISAKEEISKVSPKEIQRQRERRRAEEGLYDYDGITIPL